MPRDPFFAAFGNLDTVVDSDDEKEQTVPVQDVKMPEAEQAPVPHSGALDLYDQARNYVMIDGATISDVHAYIDMLTNIFIAPNSTPAQQCTIAMRMFISDARKHDIYVSLDRGLSISKNIIQKSDNASLDLVMELSSKADILTGLIQTSYSLSAHAILASCQANGQSISDKTGLAPYMSSDESANEFRKPVHDVMDFIYGMMANRRLRKLDNILYEPVFINTKGGVLDGTNTMFYRELCTVEAFVYDSVGRFTSEKLYYILHSGRNAMSTVETITKSNNDPRVHILKQSRHHFSFQNGIFDARDGQFYLYRPDPAYPDIKATSKLDNNIATSNLFEFTVPVAWAQANSAMRLDPSGIETEVVEKVLDSQKFDADVKMWTYGMCGRMVFNVGEKEDWQVALFMRGLAGTGKSTILRIISEFYQPDKIGQLMSDGQGTFADEHLVGKYMVLALEVDETMKFAMTRFNSFVSGERVSINRKHKLALHMQWLAHLGFASNSGPAWRDQGGNLARRFLIWPFDEVVSNVDATLFSRAKLQMGALLIKCVYTFLNLVAKFGKGSLWNDGVLPALFHKTKAQYLAESNPIAAFMALPIFKKDKEETCDGSMFRAVLMKFCRDNGHPRPPPLSKGSAGNILKPFGISISTPPGGGMILSGISMLVDASGESVYSRSLAVGIDAALIESHAAAPSSEVGGGKKSGNHYIGSDGHKRSGIGSH